MMLMAIFIFLFIKLIRIIVKLSVISNDEGFNIFLILYIETRNHTCCCGLHNEINGYCLASC